jgi:hypothetical protein
MLRKRNPLSFGYKDYLNDAPDCYRMNYDEVKKKNEWIDSNKCDHCGTTKGYWDYFCLKCKL